MAIQIQENLQLASTCTSQNLSFRKAQFKDIQLSEKSSVQLRQCNDFGKARFGIHVLKGIKDRALLACFNVDL